LEHLLFRVTDLAVFDGFCEKVNDPGAFQFRDPLGFCGHRHTLHLALDNHLTICPELECVVNGTVREEVAARESCRVAICWVCANMPLNHSILTGNQYWFSTGLADSIDHDGQICAHGLRGCDLLVVMTKLDLRWERKSYKESP